MKHLKSYNEQSDYLLKNKGKISFDDVHRMSDDELLEMANVTYDETGIENIVLWMGPNPSQHGHRVKVSNIPNSFEGSDCFVITIPGYKIIGESKIKPKKLKEVINFIKLNEELIISYSNYELSTKSF